VDLVRRSFGDSKALNKVLRSLPWLAIPAGVSQIIEIKISKGVKILDSPVGSALLTFKPKITLLHIHIKDRL
jgi:hypothetical protein